MMKKLCYLFILTFTVISCSNDDSPLDDYPKNMDIEFEVESTDTSRLSIIETTVLGEGLDLSAQSISNEHLPFKKRFFQQRVPFQSGANLYFRDNSGAALGAVFVPYFITLKIRINGEIKAIKEVQITESGMVENLTLDSL